MTTLNSYIFWWRCIKKGTIGRLEFPKRNGIPPTHVQLAFARSHHEESNCNCNSKVFAVHGDYLTIKNMEWPDAILYIPAKLN